MQNKPSDRYGLELMTSHTAAGSDSGLSLSHIGKIIITVFSNSTPVSLSGGTPFLYHCLGVVASAFCFKELKL
ncbi:hypothetical protein ACFLU0_00815 [Chloroflexota bacterium]